MSSANKQTIVKMVLQLIRGQKTIIDPYFIKVAKNYGFFFETEPTPFTGQKVKKIIIEIKDREAGVSSSE